VLDDGNAGTKQQGVGGPFAVCGVVDVGRVDADSAGWWPASQAAPARVRKCACVA
jgi:hypothetical protein